MEKRAAKRAKCFHKLVQIEGVSQIDNVSFGKVYDISRAGISFYTYEQPFLEQNITHLNLQVQENGKWENVRIELVREIPGNMETFHAGKFINDDKEKLLILSH